MSFKHEAQTACTGKSNFGGIGSPRFSIAAISWATLVIKFKEFSLLDMKTRMGLCWCSTFEHIWMRRFECMYTGHLYTGISCIMHHDR